MGIEPMLMPVKWQVPYAQCSATRTVGGIVKAVFKANIKNYVYKLGTTPRLIKEMH